MSQQGCVFLVQIVLARLLEPAQFGLVAMVAVFVVISGAVVESGLGTALVQKKEATGTDCSTVFWFNLMVAFLMVACLWLAAPLVARFYAQPDLIGILRVLGLGLIIGAAGSVHASLLRRELQFRKLFWVSTPSTLLSGAIGIALAFQGRGVWALVGQTLSQTAFRTISLWMQTGWRPRAVYDWGSLRSMLPFGSRLAVSGILDRGFQNLYVLVIGRVFSPIEVGFFQRAFSFQQLPVTNLNSVVGSVAFPVLAQLQHEPARMRKVLGTSLHLTALFGFTIMAVLAAIAEPLVIVLIGDKWRPCVPMIRWLCLAGALYPLHATNLSLLTAIGRSDLFLRLEIIKKSLTLVNVALTWRFGVQVMIYGMILTSFLALVVNTFYTNKFIHYGLGQQLRDLLPMLGLAIAVFVSLVALARACSFSPIWQLMLAAVCASGIFISALRLMPEIVRREIGVVLDRSALGRRLSFILLGRPPQTAP